MRKTNKKTYKKKSYKRKLFKKKKSYKFTKKNLKKTYRRLRKGGNGEEDNWPEQSWGTASEITDETEICPVCHEKFKETPNKAIYKTSCGHKLHNDCLLVWHSQGKNNCPICRQDIDKDMSDVFSFKNKMLGRMTNDFQEIPISSEDFNGKDDVLRIYQEQPDSR